MTREKRPLISMCLGRNCQKKLSGDVRNAISSPGRTRKRRIPNSRYCNKEVETMVTLEMTQALSELNQVNYQAAMKFMFE